MERSKWEQHCVQWTCSKAYHLWSTWDTSTPLSCKDIINVCCNRNESVHLLLLQVDKTSDIQDNTIWVEEDSVRGCLIFVCLHVLYACVQWACIITVLSADFVLFHYFVVWMTVFNELAGYAHVQCFGLCTTSKCTGVVGWAFECIQYYRTRKYYPSSSIRKWAWANVVNMSGVEYVHMYICTKRLYVVVKNAEW